MAAPTTPIYTYSYIRISKSHNLEASAQQYRNLRLRGLQASPSSFASTYETEAAFTSTDWETRLSAADKQTFICVATSQGTQQVSEWVGQVTLRGPMSRADFALAPEAGQLAVNCDDEERWQLLGLFLLPDHRGGGRGKQLCQAALEYLGSYLPSPFQVHVRLMIKPDNQAIVRLYEGLDFTQTGKCTLEEAIRASGDGYLLPDDTSSEKYSIRTGLIMNLKMKQ
ncbi:hypothetical protein NLG97_g4864 [Lecanicillium saksenae]|uniref:Uncharacterized protein n=1 Tax=Lecanicillium saksenae TaxID=468837 RepID=A0ACC1QU42_9HYPO|nr:hypothetical protein NLG97_g4864 [Lecanicillium saksenae]